MSLTVFEQQFLGVRDVASASTLTRLQATSILELAEVVGARIASWRGLAELQVHQYVGVISRRGFQVEILPKLDALEVPARCRQGLVAMLAATKDLKLSESEAAEAAATNEPFGALFAKLYCRRLLAAVRRGLRQDYVLHEESLPTVRGKIAWAAQARVQASQRLEFACTFDDRSEDTLLNQVLKAALGAATSILEGSHDTTLAMELRQSLAAVRDVHPNADHLARVKTDRTNHHVAPLLALAKLLLANRSPDVRRGDERGTYAMLWDMNVLFEEYVGRMTIDVMESSSTTCELQGESITHLAVSWPGDRPAFRLKPDILMRQQRQVIGVADTKWKRLQHGHPTLGIGEADLYQVLTYAHRYATQRAFLIYPHHPSLGAPGIQRRFRIGSTGGDATTVLVATLNLASIETAREQIKQIYAAG